TVMSGRRAWKRFSARGCGSAGPWYARSCPGWGARFFRAPSHPSWARARPPPEGMGAARPSVTLLEPPVDVRANAPDVDPGPFRADLGLDAATPLICVVCRLVPMMKLEGVLSACDAVGELARSGVAVQLAVVGDGPSRPEVEAAAAAANARAGRRVVVLAGEMYDPRPAYAAADVVLGMGGSALRGMAFCKTLVVQGVSGGYWELATPESAPAFLNHGWGGLGPEGDGRPEGTARLMGILPALLADPATRARLGEYGRTLVVQRYSLDHAAARQEEVYASAVRTTAHPSAIRLAADATRTGTGAFWHKARRRWQRRRGTVVSEDFNVVSEPPVQEGGQ